MHCAPAYWTQPDDFLPERWIVKKGHEFYRLKGAYRALEIGPRNCLAQRLAMTELRAVLAGIVRRYIFKPAYEKLDRMILNKSLQTYRGERVYQIKEGAAHPVDQYSCRASTRENKEVTSIDALNRANET